MARKKTPKVRVNVKASISRRLREIRQELFGEHGGPELARKLNLPARTWYNYETGVTVPAEVLLGFIDETGANPVWLLSGEGPKFNTGLEDEVLANLTPVQLIRRGLEKLERDPGDLAISSPDDLAGDPKGDFVSVGLYPLADLGKPHLDPASSEGKVLAYRHWLPHPKETIAVRLNDESMSPILPSGSVVAIDRAVTDSKLLQGKLVAGSIDGVPMIRWLEISGRHMILRPNLVSREFSLIAIEVDDISPNPIIGQVVWSWSRFSG